MGKSVISARVELETFEKFTAICKAERRSQAVMLAIMIEGYKAQPIKQQQLIPVVEPKIDWVVKGEQIEAPKPLPKRPIPVKKVVTSLTIKDEPKKFNLLEAMANASK